jgi:chromosome partitioning protein
LRTIAIINQKGGCGKTTVSVNLAAVLAAKGHRTLLVDMDPQSHCALGLAVPESQVERSIGEMLRAGLSGAMAFSDVVWQISRNFDLAPSTMALAALEQELAPAPDRDRRLMQVLSTVGHQYDFCIIDCPPSIGLLTFNALRAADEVIIPVETGFFAMQGSIKQEATIEMLARRAGHHVRFKVLATMYDVRTKLAREILSELRRHYGEKLLPIVVNFNSKLKEAASFGQPITEYDPASRGMQDFERLAEWLMVNPPPRPIEQATAAVAATPGAALSWAAELVERARALSARTAAMNSRFPGHAPATGEEPMPKAPTTPTPAAEHQPLAPRAEDEGILTQAPCADANPKLRRLFGVRPTRQGLLFVQPASTARRVQIAGDFNDWDPQRTPLTRDSQLGVWQTLIHVPPGRYRYRVVIDGQWVQDPYNQTVEANPYGELDNVVEIQDSLTS